VTVRSNASGHDSNVQSGSVTQNFCISSKMRAVLVVAMESVRIISGTGLCVFVCISHELLLTQSLNDSLHAQRFCLILIIYLGRARLCVHSEGHCRSSLVYKVPSLYRTKTLRKSVALSPSLASARNSLQPVLFSQISVTSLFDDACVLAVRMDRHTPKQRCKLCGEHMHSLDVWCHYASIV
jgi:hypothetical protein